MLHLPSSCRHASRRFLQQSLRAPSYNDVSLPLCACARVLSDLIIYKVLLIALTFGSKQRWTVVIDTFIQS